MKLRSFGAKIGTEFTHLFQTWIFYKISFMSFFSPPYCSLWCQVSIKFFELISRYSKKYKNLQTHKLKYTHALPYTHTHTCRQTYDNNILTLKVFRLINKPLNEENVVHKVLSLILEKVVLI